MKQLRNYIRSRLLMCFISSKMLVKNHQVNVIRIVCCIDLICINSDTCATCKCHESRHGVSKEGREWENPPTDAFGEVTFSDDNVDGQRRGSSPNEGPSCGQRVGKVGI